MFRIIIMTFCVRTIFDWYSLCWFKQFANASSRFLYAKLIVNVKINIAQRYCLSVFFFSTFIRLPILNGFIIYFIFSLRLFLFTFTLFVKKCWLLNDKKDPCMRKYVSRITHHQYCCLLHSVKLSIGFEMCVLMEDTWKSSLNIHSSNQVLKIWANRCILPAWMS